jgi:carbon monoxide dehydrogenase subunit G|tara:strand:+ start:271 stop:858 length:588 start_codon:yes stop_codon:yes gene_type:complete
MKLSGSYQISLEKQKVWEALNDPEILRKSIPGCEDFKKDSETSFTATATNKIGPFNASFTGNIELKEINAPHSYVIEGSGDSPVGFASGEAKVKLEDAEGGTNLIYEVEANVGGKIAQVGSRLIDMTAKKMADIFFGNFSDLISKEKISRETEIKPISENQKINFSEKRNKFSNKKITIYISLVILLGIVIYLIK